MSLDDDNETFHTQAPYVGLFAVAVPMQPLWVKLGEGFIYVRTGFKAQQSRIICMQGLAEALHMAE